MMETRCSTLTSEKLSLVSERAELSDLVQQQQAAIKKQAEMSLVETDKEPDPARTSENVRLALSFSEMTGPAPPRPKKRLEMSAYLPTYL